MKLYNTMRGPVLDSDGRLYVVEGVDWDSLVARDDLSDRLHDVARRGSPFGFAYELDEIGVLAPIGSQEVWAAGVTYFRSRDARMEESQDAGGGDFYDRVYSAARPELFFKSSAHRVVGHGQEVRIRSDSRWNVPEPELTLLVAASGKIVGYTIGNDMSSRDIEGENPLYLPQAKVYVGSCALGPGVLVHEEELPQETGIHLRIERAGKIAFEGATALSQIKRSFDELVEYLFREDAFPRGCYLMTGTGVVPSPDFTLERGDEIRITVDPIGTLVNRVASSKGPRPGETRVS